MFIDIKLSLIIFAGLCNGSFVIPARYIKKMAHATIWFYYSIFTLLLMPWLLLFLISPQLIHHYALLNRGPFLFLIMSGLIYGLGQSCFIYAIDIIGVALSFAISLGVGLIIGSLFVVFDRSEFFTHQGYLVTLSVLLIATALAMQYLASRNNSSKSASTTTAHKSYGIGWLLALLTGFANGLQNIAFVVTAFHGNAQVQTSNSYWVWPIFLSAAACPMLIVFWYKAKMDKIPISMDHTPFFDKKNLFLLILMSFLFTGSLALYSTGMSLLSSAQQIIGWPIFMVCIILISQAWGLFFGEMKKQAIKNKMYSFSSIALLIISMIILL